ncbi:hypothetical protein Tco_0742690 [Tanacetum coccineum]
MVSVVQVRSTLHQQTHLTLSLSVIFFFLSLNSPLSGHPRDVKENVSGSGLGELFLVGYKSFRSYLRMRETAFVPDLHIGSDAEHNCRRDALRQQKVE